MIATALNKVERYAQWTDLYVERLHPGDCTALILSHCPNGYVFDFAEAHTIKDKPIVVLDFREYGWNTSHKNCDLAGFQREEQPMYHGSEWENLEGWLLGQNIVAYFKRELSPEVSQLTSPYPVYPIDLISKNRPMFGPVKKDEYVSRKQDLMHVWGHSHEDRVEFNEVWKTGSNGTDFVKNWCENIPHYNRLPLGSLLGRQSFFLLSTALPGCGHKTFRHSESCVNCVPVISDCGMKFSVPWGDHNAVLLPTVDGRINPQQSVEIIRNALLDKDALWSKYQAAQVSALLLDQDTYMKAHVNPLIKSAL